MNPVSSHSTHYTLYPNIVMKPPETPYPKAQAENSVKAYNNPSHSIDTFKDELVEGEGIFFLERNQQLSYDS